MKLLHLLDRMSNQRLKTVQKDVLDIKCTSEDLLKPFVLIVFIQFFFLFKVSPNEKVLFCATYHTKLASAGDVPYL